jgi:hypothetical protein
MKKRIGRNKHLRFLVGGIIAAFALLLISCGTRTSSSTPNPIPNLTSISPTSALAGSRPITITVTGTSFISSSVVKWKNVSKTTTYVSKTQLTAAIPAADLTTAGTAAVTVTNPAPGGGTSSSATFTITAVSPFAIGTTYLPDAYQNTAYNYSVVASGGIAPYAYSITSGSLPGGLTFASSSGLISGTPSSVANDTASSFTVKATDSTNTPNTATQSLSLTVRTSSSLARNDSCAAATVIKKDGIIRASISPYGDIDYYSFHGTAGNTVTAEIYAQRLVLNGDSASVDSHLDSFLEILSSSCARVAYNDDISSTANLDSLVSYRLPSAGTYYIRVSDASGNGRPDFIYDLHIAGVDAQ